MSKRKIFFILISILIFRLILMGLLDMQGTTEARYASIAMRMNEFKDYITPRYIDKPFLAKPPLSFWATAISFKIFKVNDFFARLPHFLIYCLTLCFIYFSFYSDKTKKLILITVLTSFLGMFAISSMVMTESSLFLGYVMILMSFYRVCILEVNKKLYSFFFFLGVIIAMLAKGPSVIIVAGINIFFYLFIKNKWKSLFNLPVIFGSLISFLIIAPWYLLCELNNSGFINYFIIGEHFQRFINPAWDGDLYGNAHLEPIGSIWLFLFYMINPWSIYLIYIFLSKILIKKDYKKYKQIYKHDVKFYFLICFMGPMLFFSFARNIIFSYTVYAFLPVAYFITLTLNTYKIKYLKYYLYFSAVLFVFIASFLSLERYYNTPIKNISNLFLKLTKDDKEQKLVYCSTHDIGFEIQFYTKDKVVGIKPNIDIIRYMKDNNYKYITLNPRMDKKLIKNFNKFKKIKCFKKNLKNIEGCLYSIKE